jgi:predicted nucleic acid-binding Zn ribbon protein
VKRHNDLPLSELLKQWSQKDKILPMLVQKKVQAGWEDWLGKLIAKNTDKIFVSNRKLYVHLKSGPLKYELTLGREQLLQLINEKIGENYFEEILIR